MQLSVCFLSKELLWSSDPCAFCLTPGPGHALTLWCRVCGAAWLGPKPCGAILRRDQLGSTDSERVPDREPSAFLALHRLFSRFAPNAPDRSPLRCLSLALRCNTTEVAVLCFYPFSCMLLWKWGVSYCIHPKYMDSAHVRYFSNLFLSFSHYCSAHRHVCSKHFCRPFERPPSTTLSRESGSQRPAASPSVAPVVACHGWPSPARRRADGAAN